MEFTLRRAGASDADALSLLASAAFLESYAALIPGRDIVAHCAARNAPAVFAAWLADPAATLWLAESPTGAPIGYCLVVPATLPDAVPSPQDREVMRIYVLSRYHGAGIGHRLMAEAVAEARAAGVPRLVLGVFRQNARALAFYARQGFAEIASRVFVVGASRFDDAVLALPLR